MTVKNKHIKSSAHKLGSKINRGTYHTVVKSEKTHSKTDRVTDTGKKTYKE